MDEVYYEKYLKYKTKYLKQKIINEGYADEEQFIDDLYGGRPGVFYLTEYKFDDLFRQFVSKVIVRVTLKCYMTKTKKYILLNNINVLFTSLKGMFGIHVEEKPGSGRFTKNSQLIRLDGAKIKFTKCTDPIHGSLKDNDKDNDKDVWQISCPGDDKVVTIYPPNYNLKIPASRTEPEVDKSKQQIDPYISSLYNFIRAYFVENKIIPPDIKKDLQINKNPQFIFSGLISGRAFSPANVDFKDLFDKTLGVVFKSIRDIKKDDHIEYLLSRIFVMVYEGEPDVESKVKYIHTKSIKAFPGTLSNELNTAKQYERAYCVTPNRSLSFGSFFSPVSGTWADVKKYFGSNRDIINSQVSPYDDPGSKVKLLRDKNNLFVLCHGPSAKKGKGGALDEELDPDMWYKKLVAINTHVMCMALIHIAFYSGVLNEKYLTELFEGLDLDYRISSH